MTAVQIPLPLPLLPGDWSGTNDFKAFHSLSAPVQRNVEPVGPHFLAHARRKRHKRTFSEDERILAQENVKQVEDGNASYISEPEDPLMLQRDPKDWKNQDHYAVLGLSKHRHRASEEQIKLAHRRKVLKHHPDKKAAVGATDDDSFFKCIQKATDILLDPVKRQQYDSVDEGANVAPPSRKQTQKGDFYKLWAPFFASEGRFSKSQPVPRLGDDASAKEDVEHFYNFWYNFDSWRSFEYQDEDVPDDNENRDQKRHVERKNQNARKKKKTEDIARLRRLVDEALALDERIKRFKKLEHAQKNKKRFEKEAEAKRLADEAASAKEEATRRQAEADAADKVKRAEDKKAKEAAKNAVRKNKRTLRTKAKEANYFHADGDAPPAVIDAVLGDVDVLIAQLEAVELADFASRLAPEAAAANVKAAFSEQATRLLAAGKLKDGEVKHLLL